MSPNLEMHFSQPVSKAWSVSSGDSADENDKLTRGAAAPAAVLTLLGGISRW